MGWNTGFSLVTDINKGCYLLMVLKLNAWRGVCSVARLDTNILVETSVWGSERVQNRTEKPHLTLFLILHNWLLQKLRFWEWHEILRCGIFPMAQNVKTPNLEKNWAFFVEKHAVYTKLWKYKPILWPMCFLVDLVRKKNLKNYQQHPV